MDEEKTIDCAVCKQAFFKRELFIFEKKSKGIRIKGVCEDCLNFLESKHSKKKAVSSPEPEPEPEPLPTLNRRNLAALGGVQTPQRNVEVNSNGSSVSQMSGNFTKFYCCENACRTPTGRIKFFRSHDAWMVHMLGKHKATTSYQDYLMMDHVMENFPHKDDDVCVLSKFGNLGL